MKNNLDFILLIELDHCLILNSINIIHILRMQRGDVILTRSHCIIRTYGVSFISHSARNSIRSQAVPSPGILDNVKCLNMEKHYPKKLSWLEIVTLIGDRNSKYGCLDVLRSLIKLDYRALLTVQRSTSYHQKIASPRARVPMIPAISSILPSIKHELSRTSFIRWMS